MTQADRKHAETTFACQHCGARYTVLVVQLPHPEPDEVRCQVCEEVMATWQGANRPVFRLIKRA